MAVSTQSSSAQSEAAQSEAAQSEAAQPEAAQPDGVESTPQAVPTGAVFDQEVGGWVSVALDDAGQRHGEYRAYRKDGSLLLRGDYRCGQREGRFLGYHPNGDLASEGEYREGQLQGVFVRHASTGSGAIPLRGCCVPPGARTMELNYDGGRVVRETFKDDGGHALLSDGTLRPLRPSALDDRVDFEESSRRWVMREEHEGVSLRRYFDVEGHLVEEVELSNGRRLRTRSYVENEQLLEAREFDEKGKLTGAYYRHHQQSSPYVDARIASERGHFEQGHPTGEWLFLDVEGATLRQVNRGSLPGPTEWATACMVRYGSDAQRRQAIDEAFEQSHVRVGLLLAARALGATGHVEEWTTRLERVVVPIAERQADAWRQVFARASQVNMDVAMDGLLSGAEPAEALRVLSTMSPEGSPAALELVEASLTLRPADVRTLANRAMLRLESGDVDGARADAHTLAGRGENEVAAELQETSQVLFSSLVYSPSTEASKVSDPALPAVPFDQSLDAVCRVLRMYATRMTRMRDLLCRQSAKAPSWLPDVPTALLDKELEQLNCGQVTIVDDTEEGTEESEALVDETEGLDAPSALRAMTTLRADWAAMCWLCWAVGLNRVELPKAIVPPNALSTVVNETMVRCFRIHDQLRTRGLASRSKGIPAFEWEGRSVDTLSRTLCRVAAREYLERRAVLFWALFSQNISPFQSDLRKV